MLARIFILLLAGFLIATAALLAQEPPAGGPTSAPITTDRPSVTDASIVVPAGSIQVENGFQATSVPALRTLDGPESLIRFGLLPKTELRLYVPDYYYNQSLGISTGPAPGSGFGDLALGVKQQLGPTRGFDVSVVAFVSFPTGADAISSHGYDPGVQLSCSRSLTPKWTLAGMLSFCDPTQGGRRNPTGEPTIVLDRQLAAPWSGFVEYAGDFKRLRPRPLGGEGGPQPALLPAGAGRGSHALLVVGVRG
jgi:hypothetical protein